MRRPAALLALVPLAAALAGCGGQGTVKAEPETVRGGTTATTGTTTTGTTTTTETGPNTTGTTTTGTTTGTTTTTPGGAAKGDPAAGKKIFLSAGCSGCHTLNDAGSNGNVGPNLDDAKPDYSLVVDRVTNGRNAMPPFKGQLSDTQIQDVAAYVSSVAGK